MRIGDLIFEEHDDPDEGKSISVQKASDLLGWVNLAPCPNNDYQWTLLRNRCYPINGRGDRPPHGTWVVHEYVGKEGCSSNIDPPDTSKDGFTNQEIQAIMAVVNLMYCGTADHLVHVTEGSATHH